MTDDSSQSMSPRSSRIASPLSDAHAGDSEQPEQRLERRRLQWRGQPPRRRQESGDLSVGVQAGRRRLIAGRSEQVRGRDLGGGVERVQVPGEAAHRVEPVGPPDRARLLRLGRPGQSQFGGDGARAGAFGEGHEAGEDAGGVFEFVADASAQGEIVIQGLT